MSTKVVCIDCGAEQTHRVCAECFAFQQEEAQTYWTMISAGRSQMPERSRRTHDDYLPDSPDE